MGAYRVGAYCMGPIGRERPSGSLPTHATNFEAAKALTCLEVYCAVAYPVGGYNLGAYNLEQHISEPPMHSLARGPYVWEPPKYIPGA